LDLWNDFGYTMRQLAQSGLGILLVTHHVSEIIPEIERVILLTRPSRKNITRSVSGLILLVTYHVSEITPEIERVILLREGRVIADGSKSAVLTEEHLSKLFGVAVRLGRSDGYFHLY